MKSVSLLSLWIVFGWRVCIQCHLGLFSDEEYVHLVSVDCFQMKRCNHYHYGLLSDEESEFMFSDEDCWIYYQCGLFSDEDSVRAVSLWVVCDLETVEGRDLMYSAIKQAVSYKHFLPGLQHCCREIIRLCRNACLCLCCSVLFCFR